jgi:hypothetical protein
MAVGKKKTGTKTDDSSSGDGGIRGILKGGFPIRHIVRRTRRRVRGA